MNRNAVAVIEQAGAYAHLFDRVSTGARFDEASSTGPIRLATDAELLEAVASSTRLIRLVEAERVQLTAELARRSQAQDESSLANQLGATGTTDLLAQLAGITHEQAGTTARLASAVQPREALTGEPLPAARPHVAAALAAGRLDLTVASGLVRAVRKAEPGLSPGEADELERQLVDRAQQGYTADELLRHFREVPGFANPDGVGSSDAEHAAAASVTKRVLDNGLTRWVLDLDPLTNGFFETALNANTAIRRPVNDPDQPIDDATDDPRPLQKRRVDGIRLLSKRAVKDDDGQVAGTAVTLLVTMTEEALRTGIGTATLLECESTISAAVARMLAVDAELIPVVLGGKSQVLDFGTSRRFFTEAQRRAMALRSGGGCEGPDCDAPLSWCDDAHIRPAGYGPTSLDNGLLLCWRCHLLHDQHGWQVERVHGSPRWTPPPWIDPTGRKRPGGRIPALHPQA